MSSFRTEIEVCTLDFQISHAQRGLCIGSCFAQNIADRLIEAKFTVESNPFGVLYNPMSIAQTLERLDGRVLFEQWQVVQNGDLWCNFAMHGSFSHQQKEAALEQMNVAVNRGADALAVADYVVITFGTAWIYQLAGGGDGAVVANCHKFPNATFVRKRLTVEQIVECYDRLLEGALRNKRVLFTLSPIRHLKDGMHQNTLSKATLSLAIEAIIERHAGQCSYFPSYEIMMDDLRDYRFWTEDMVHPSPLAVEYIWNAFTRSTMAPETLQLIQEIERVVQAFNHRPFNPQSPSHQRFREQTLQRVARLATANPAVDFSRELDYFSKNTAEE